MWTYVQSSGLFFSQDGKLSWVGYSGFGSGKNNPAKECEKSVGPIPLGFYAIGPEVVGGTTGPVSLRLVADDPNYCNPPRSGFLIHGDNATGTASTGCIVLSPRKVRETIRDSDDKRLRVVRASMKAFSLGLTASVKVRQKS